VRFDYLIKLGWLEQVEVSDEVEDSLNLNQRSSSDICEATEFFGAPTADALGEVQNDAITSTAPLIRQVTFDSGQPIDERPRHYGKASRVLVGLQVFEDHVGR